jgi:translation initiation factor 4E
LGAISRISPNAPASTSSSSRPRLATSILRSDSRASTLTTGTAHSGDSTAVNPPSTRPVSPTASERSLASGTLPTTLDASATGSIPPEGIPAPIVDKEEKLIRGYKNIPSLTAITERMRRTKLENSQNISGSGNAATIVVTGPQSTVATPISEVPVAVSSQDAEEEPTGEEHPLQHTWYDRLCC